MTAYATLDTEQAYVNENADILAFDSEEEARQYLTEAYAEFLRDAKADGEPMNLSIEEARFSDCWIKSHTEPDAETPWLDPFTLDQVIVQRPGQHPGGPVYWVTPSEPVLVAVLSPQ